MKFSIRDLFLMTVIVALVLAWWIDRSRLAGEIRRLTPQYDNSNIHDSS